MVSTVTNSVVSAMSSISLAGSLAIVGVLVLFALLVQKEISTASDDSRMKRFGQVLYIGIIPLMIAFVLLVIFKVSDVLM